MKPTIRDVAKKANVSVATVSRVINEKGYVYEETRKTVLKIIDELGFEPNQLARSLTNHRSKMIGGCLLFGIIQRKNMLRLRRRGSGKQAGAVPESERFRFREPGCRYRLPG